MKEHEILAAVRTGGDLAGSDRAEVATHATLEVLACRLKGSEVPAGIAEALPSVPRGEEFGLEEFYRRVAEAEGATSAQGPAREHARAVIAALKSGVRQDEFDDLAARLPADYRDDLLSTSATNS